MIKLWTFYQITHPIQVIFRFQKISLDRLLFAVHLWQNHKRFRFWCPDWNSSYWFTKSFRYNWPQHFNLKPFLCFTNETIKWYTSYLSNRQFIISIENAYSDKASIKCGEPQSSVLGPPLFLLYSKDMLEAVNSELLLHTDDTCLVFQQKDIKTLEEIESLKL